MKFPPAPFVALVRLLRRDGFSFFGKCARYATSREAWRWLLRGGGNAPDEAIAAQWPRPARRGPPASFAKPPDAASGPIPDLPPEERARSRRMLAGYSPKISIVVASYNYAHLIRETLDSLAAQTYRNFEVLVIDNASSDDSVEVVGEYVRRDPRFTLTVHEVNLGLPGSVRHGARLATGEFVAFCEADDVWTPDHLEKKVELLREHWGEPNFIVNDIQPFGEPGRIREILPMMETRRPMLAGTRNRIPPEAFRRRNWIFTFSMCMVRRETLLRCDMESVPRPSNLDWWLWRQIGLENDVYCVHEPLTKWRLHRSSYTCRDDNAGKTADGYDLISAMDRLLVRAHPVQAESLRAFLRPEDAFRCENGSLVLDGTPVEGPRFTVTVPLIGSAAALARTFESLAAQTYGSFEAVLVGRADDPATAAAAASLREILGPEKSVRVSPCPFVDLSAMIEAAFPAADGEWGMLVLPGDVLRPEALQTFAARIVLDPDADGFWATSRCLESNVKFAPLPDAKPTPFAAPGSFAFRLSVPEPSGAPRFPDFPELRLLLRTVSGRKAVFVDHAVLLHDDAPDGLDPFGRRIFAAAAAFAKHRGDPPPPAMPADPFKDMSLVSRSRFFDGDYYLRDNADVARAGMEPFVHYARYGTTPDRNPSVQFIGDEYLAVNPDVGYAKVHPLVHYERHGRTEGRLVSFLENDRAPSFPKGSVPLSRSFGTTAPGKRRTAVFAGYSGDGRIPETDLEYLRGLREVCDNVVYVSNNPVFPDEADKLDGLVRAALFECHGEYDFGSYKRGWLLAKEAGLLAPSVCDEVVIANNSCYGPVFPFSRTFAAMSSRSCDFWGLSACRVLGRDHLQSFFLVFRRRILDGPELDSFLRSVTRQPSRGYIVMRYEFEITKRLADAGYSFDSLVPVSFHADKGVVPSRMPVTTMERYGFPILKAKVVNGDSRESVDRALEIVRNANPGLAAAIRRGSMERRHPRLSVEDHRASFAATVARIAAKAAAGEPVRAVFPVSNPSMFPARPLFDAMRADARFDARIVVVPDMRGLDRDPAAARRACREELGRSIPADRFLDAEPDEFGLYPDVLAGADVVCYPSPYDLSCFRFNPHYAVGRSFLPIHVNYGFYRSVYDRDIVGRQNYAWFWKAFFECEATAKEYAEHSILKGANAEVVGYVKMDALAAAEPWPRNGSRKRVLIAPHHSVEGGANDTLALSNFQRYADYFLTLPERHPEIDFVFRPHPFLFTVLSHPSRWGQAKVDDWIARMKAHPNVRWSDEGDYFPVFASCDACVQDCGSYLVEWFYTGRPCCYMLKDPSDIDAKFAPLGKDCLSHCYLAYDEAANESFLRDVVEGGADPKAAARDEFRKTVMVNHPHAADAALASIKRALGMA